MKRKLSIIFKNGCIPPKTRVSEVDFQLSFETEKSGFTLDSNQIHPDMKAIYRHMKGNDNIKGRDNAVLSNAIIKLADNGWLNSLVAFRFPMHDIGNGLSWMHRTHSCLHLAVSCLQLALSDLKKSLSCVVLAMSGPHLAMSGLKKSLSCVVLAMSGLVLAMSGPEKYSSGFNRKISQDNHSLISGYTLRLSRVRLSCIRKFPDTAFHDRRAVILSRIGIRSLGRMPPDEIP